MQEKTKLRMGRPPRFNLKWKIIKLIKENPRRVGTKAHENFKLIRSKMTVARYKQIGGDMRDLRYAVDKKWIEVVPPRKKGASKN